MPGNQRTATNNACPNAYPRLFKIRVSNNITPINNQS